MQPQYDRFGFDSKSITLFPDSDFFAPYDVLMSVFFQWVLDNDLAPEYAYNDVSINRVVYVSTLTKTAQSWSYIDLLNTLIFCEKEGRSSDSFVKHNISDLMAMYAEDTTFEELEPEESEHEIINDAVDFRRTQ